MTNFKFYTNKGEYPYSNGFWRFAIMVLTIVLINASAAFSQAVGPGVAPIAPPPGGFHIEGNLKANIPTCGIGDWLPGTGTGSCSSGGSVLDATGGPIVSTTTYHIIDSHSSGDDVFAGGQKKDDNPNLMTWISGNPSPAKNDINNFLMHISTQEVASLTIPGNVGDTWILLSGDRESTNGNSFLSLQFLQKTLTKVGTTSGTFASAASNATGGRTVGDLQISAEFVNGGGNPVLYLERWELSGGVYKWVAKLFPAGSAFGAVNGSTLTVQTSETQGYRAFNRTTYKPNAFMEVAVNITAIIQAVSGGECLGRISTLWPMTKSSQSVSANMTDFVSPIQIDLDINIDLTVTDPDPTCDGTFDLEDAITSDKAGLTFEYYDSDPTASSAPDPLASSVVSESGTYYIKAISTTATLCNDVAEVKVSIGDTPARPVIELLAAELCDGGRTAPAIQILCPIDGGTYIVKQDGETDKTQEYSAITDNSIIEDLVAGKDFSITVTVGGCMSDATDCSNYTENSCGSRIIKSQSSSSLKGVEPAKIDESITAYPVPFSNRVTVEFKMAKSERYEINLYDMKGNLVKQLRSGKAKAGELQQIEVDGANLAEGMYLVRVVSSQGAKTIKLLKKE